MKKIISVILVISLLLAVLSACGKSDSSPEKSSEPKTEAGESIELTFFYPIQVGGPLTQTIEKFCDDFTKENPEIKIKPVYTGSYDDTVVKIQTSVQGGNPPDVFVNLATQRFSMASSNTALPLEEMIEGDTDGKEYIDDFLTGFMEDSYVEGKIYSIPFQRSTMVLFYNKAAFTEVGLDPEKPPVNWDELIDYSQKLTNDDRYGVGIALNSGSAQWAFTGFALENSIDGKNLMSDDGKEVYFDTPENVEALQLWLDLQNKYKSMQEGIVQWTNLPTQFLSGEVAMMYHTTGNLTNINENADFDYGVSFLPAGKQYGTPTGGGNLYISQDISPERQAAAWKFIRFLTEPERVAQWSIDTGYVATREAAFETEALKTFYSNVPQAAVAKDQLEYARPELTTYDSAKIWRILNDNIQSAVTGEMSAEDALKNAQTEADEALSKYQ